MSSKEISSKSPVGIQRRVLIAGQVQGVGFRYATFIEAKKFPKLQGFVQNLPDGRVHATFAGNEKAVSSMVAWCHKGPPSASVSKIEIIEEPYDSSLRNFRIIRKGTAES